MVCSYQPSIDRILNQICSLQASCAGKNILWNWRRQAFSKHGSTETFSATQHSVTRCFGYLLKPISRKINKQFSRYWFQHKTIENSRTWSTSWRDWTEKLQMTGYFLPTRRLILESRNRGSWSHVSVFRFRKKKLLCTTSRALFPHKTLALLFFDSCSSSSMEPVYRFARVSREDTTCFGGTVNYLNETHFFIFCSTSWFSFISWKYETCYSSRMNKSEVF